MHALGVMTQVLKGSVVSQYYARMHILLLWRSMDFYEIVSHNAGSPLINGMNKV